jgi:hypothetical protein
MRAVCCVTEPWQTVTASTTWHACAKWFTNRKWSMAHVLKNICAGHKVKAKDFIQQISTQKELYT